MDSNQVVIPIDLEMFRCVICSSYFESPVVDSCNHTYCLECVQQWFQRSSFCPLSRKIIGCESLRKLKLVDKIMEGTVVCKNTFNGCRWSGSILSCEDHTNSCDINELQGKSAPVFDDTLEGKNLVHKIVQYNLDRYEGQMDFSVRHGKGKLFYLNGDVFEGSFLRNIKKGPGQYVFKLGGVYHGVWADGMVTDGGYFIDASGKKYSFDTQEGLYAWMRVYSNDARTLHLK